MKFNTNVKHNSNITYLLAVTFAVVLMVVTIICVGNTTKTEAFGTPSKADIQSQLDSVSDELDEASNQYTEALMAEEEAQAKVDEAENTINEANSRIDELKGDLSVRAKSTYKNGTGSILDSILGVQSLSDLFTTIDIIDKMNQKDANMVQESKELRATVEESKAALDENLAIASAKADEAEAIKNSAQAKEASLQNQLNQLTAQERQAALAASQSRSGGSSSGGGGGVAPADANAIVQRAYGELGKPYVWGACGPGGYDCSGLVSYCLTGSHCRIGTTGTFMGWPRVSNPSPGCVCTNSHHCGIYIGGGSMIHAPQTGDVVKIGGVQSGMIYVSRG